MCSWHRFTPTRQIGQGQTRAAGTPATLPGRLRRLLPGSQPGQGVRGVPVVPRHPASGPSQRRRGGTGSGRRGELAHAVEIGRNDVRDMRVAAHGPARHAKNDELSSGDLDGARGHRCGQPIGLRHELEGRPFQAQTHAVAPRSDAKTALRPEVESDHGTALRTLDDPQGLGRGIAPGWLAGMTGG